MSSTMGSRFAVVAAVVCLGSSSVLATPLPNAVVFNLQATNAAGHGTFQVVFQPHLYNAVTRTYSWELVSPVVIVDTATSLPVATLLAARVQYVDDPVVDLSFEIQAGNLVTEIHATAAQLLFPAISPAQGRASAGMSVTDTESDGASILGLVDGGGSYRAVYNGLLPVGSTFTQLLPSIIAGAGESNAAAASTPGGGAFSGIAGSVADMTAEFHFNLSANDLASGTSHWEVIPVPGPSVVAVALLGVAGLVRRRRTA